LLGIRNLIRKAENPVILFKLTYDCFENEIKDGFKLDKTDKRKYKEHEIIIDENEIAFYKAT
jgi:hypothetical protein